MKFVWIALAIGAIVLIAQKRTQKRKGGDEISKTDNGQTPRPPVKPLPPTPPVKPSKSGKYVFIITK